MPAEDFDIDRLAVYLHLTPKQVMRLADRGKLPGRKVAGLWRFAQAEIHHWLENRIGLSDEVELVEMEDVLQASPRPADQEDEPEEIVIAEMLPQEAIAVPLAAKTRNSVIRAMVDRASKTGWLWDPAKMVDAIRTREDLHPTALDNGVALMHPRRPMPTILGQAFLALGVTHSGIPFGNTSGQLTDVFFLINSVTDRGHLRTLARLARILGSPDFLSLLRNAPDAKAAAKLIVETEQQL